jgi:hypothetical protein
MKKKEDQPIKVDVGLGRTGHVPHVTGTGAHDSRPKRERTRSAKNQKAIQEFD